MSDAKNMPTKKDWPENMMTGWAQGWNDCHDAFTKYLAERKTMDEGNLSNAIMEATANVNLPENELHVMRQDIFDYVFQLFAPPTEKKLVELDEDKVIKRALEHCQELYEDRDERNTASGALIYFIKDKLVKEFAIPERRVPTVKELSIAIFSARGFSGLTSESDMIAEEIHPLLFPNAEGI